MYELYLYLCHALCMCTYMNNYVNEDKLYVLNSQYNLCYVMSIKRSDVNALPS